MIHINRDTGDFPVLCHYTLHRVLRGGSESHTSTTPDPVLFQNKFVQMSIIIIANTSVFDTHKSKWQQFTTQGEGKWKC